MRTPSRGSVFGIACLVSAGMLGCGEPHNLVGNGMTDSGGGGGGFAIPAVPPLSSGGGAGGTSGSGGTGGSGGYGPNPFVDARPIGVGPSADGPPDGPVVALPDAAAPDAPPDTAVYPDAIINSVVTVTHCSQINCPQLTALASQCDANDQACEMDSLSASVDNFCHDNGVKKQSTRLYSGPAGQDYMTTMRVMKSDGSACYTLVMNGNDDEDTEYWVFRSPSGQELARAEWNNDLDQLTLLCGGVRYVIGQVGCPGTDGEPEAGQCEDAGGACEIP
jgi:hypothetical protein